MFNPLLYQLARRGTVTNPTDPDGGGGGTTTQTAKAIPAKNALVWEDNIALTNAGIVNGTMTVSGRNFRSTNGGAMLNLTGVPTGTHVIVYDNNLRGGGIGVFSGYNALRVTIVNNFFFADTHNDSIGWGKWLYTGSNPYKVVFEHNYCEGSGVQVEISSPTWAFSFEGCIVRFNKFKNIHGDLNQFLSSGQGVLNIQGNDANIANVLVDYNEVWNEENQTHCEDLVNLFRVGGTLASPITIRRLFLRGAYYNDVNRKNGDGIYSGGGNKCRN